MELKVYLLVITFILMFTQSFSAPSGNDDENIVTPTEEMKLLYSKMLEELKQNPPEELINKKIANVVDRIGGGNIL